jgi:hypothetical protein
MICDIDEEFVLDLMQVSGFKISGAILRFGVTHDLGLHMHTEWCRNSWRGGMQIMLHIIPHVQSNGLAILFVNLTKECIYPDFYRVSSFR